MLFFVFFFLFFPVFSFYCYSFSFSCLFLSVLTFYIFSYCTFLDFLLFCFTLFSFSVVFFLPLPACLTFLLCICSLLWFTPSSTFCCFSYSFTCLSCFSFLYLFSALIHIVFFSTAFVFCLSCFFFSCTYLTCWFLHTFSFLLLSILFFLHVFYLYCLLSVYCCG